MKLEVSEEGNEPVGQDSLGRWNGRGIADDSDLFQHGSRGGNQCPARTHDGIWKPVTAVIWGVQLPDAVVKTITLKIAGQKYEVTIKGQNQSDKGTCILDTKTNPKRMTITSTDGPNRGKTLLAIYKMKNADSMRICYDLSGKEFPKDFKAPKGTQLYVVEYRRQKERPSKKTASK